MELLFATLIGVLVFSGIYLVLRNRTFPVVAGLTLLSYAVNFFLFAMGRLHSGETPILSEHGAYADPLPQALVLTAIVINFGVTALLLILVLRAHHENASDHVDSKRGEDQR